MLLSGGTYNDSDSGMSLNRQLRKEHQLKAPDVNF